MSVARRSIVVNLSERRAASSLQVSKRQDSIGRMAADLVRLQATASEREALRALMGTGRYPFTAVALFAEDARIAAMALAAAAAGP